MDRLREVIEYSNRVQDYFLKLEEYRKNISSPISGRSFYVTGSAMMGLYGVPESVNWVKDRYESTKLKVEKGEKVLPEERIRCLWIANCIDFDPCPWDSRFVSLGVIKEKFNRFFDSFF